MKQDIEVIQAGNLEVILALADLLEKALGGDNVEVCGGLSIRLYTVQCVRQGTRYYFSGIDLAGRRQSGVFGSYFRQDGKIGYYPIECSIVKV